MIDLRIIVLIRHQTSLLFTVLATSLHPLLIPEAKVKEIRLHMGAARANFEKVNVGVIEGWWNNCGRHGEGFEMIVRSAVWLCSLNGVALRGVAWEKENEQPAGAIALMVEEKRKSRMDGGQRGSYTQVQLSLASDPRCYCSL